MNQAPAFPGEPGRAERLQGVPPGSTPAFNLKK
jgi:hypothetical protein